MHVLDTSTNQIVSTIVLLGATGYQHDSPAMTKDEKFAYTLARVSPIGTSPIRPALFQVDFRSFTAAKVMDFPLSYENPYDIEVSPDGTRLLVSTYTLNISAQLYIFDSSSASLLNTVTFCTGVSCGVGWVQMKYITFSPNSMNAYVHYFWKSSSATPREEIKVVDLSTFTVVATISSPNPSIAPSLNTLDQGYPPYLFSLLNKCQPPVCNPIRRFDTVTNTFHSDTGNIPVSTVLDFAFLEIARTPSGGKFIVLGDADYTTYNFLTVIDAISGTVVAQIPASEAVIAPIYSSKLNQVWSHCFGLIQPFSNSCERGKVDVFDLNTMTKIKTLELIQSIGDIAWPAFSPDNKFFYLSNYKPQGAVIAVDTATYQQTAIQVGKNPVGVFIQGNTATHQF